MIRVWSYCHQNRLPWKQNIKLYRAGCHGDWSEKTLQIVAIYVEDWSELLDCGHIAMKTVAMETKYKAVQGWLP